MSKNTNINMLRSHDEKSIASVKEKVIAYDAMGKDTNVEQLNKNIREPERMIRDKKSDQVKKPPTSVDQ